MTKKAKAVPGRKKLSFHRTSWLVLHNGDQERWSRRHGIERFSYPCSDCGMVLTTTIPFASGEMRGLVAPKCVCGNEGTPYCIVGIPGL